MCTLCITIERCKVDDAQFWIASLILIDVMLVMLSSIEDMPIQIFTSWQESIQNTITKFLFILIICNVDVYYHIGSTYQGL